MLTMECLFTPAPSTSSFSYNRKSVARFISNLNATDWALNGLEVLC
jgi:hypothetical protein